MYSYSIDKQWARPIGGLLLTIIFNNKESLRAFKMNNLTVPSLWLYIFFEVYQKNSHFSKNPNHEFVSPRSDKVNIDVYKNN